MMTFDVTWFGYGAGLVMCGWIAGMLVSVVLNIVGRMGKLGAYVLVGVLLAWGTSVHAQGASNLIWISSPVTVQGVPYTVAVQVTCPGGDSLGSVLGGAMSVPYACQGAVGAAQVSVEVPPVSGSSVSLAVNGDAGLSSASVVSAVPGNTVSSGVSFICGVACVLAFAWAAGGRWL
jgi:hypothetical protein